MDDPRQPPENMLQSQSKWFPGSEPPRRDAPRDMVGGGYVLKDKDTRDVAALCEKFGIDNPLAE